MQPGQTASQGGGDQPLIKHGSGRIAVVLGAGNIDAIGQRIILERSNGTELFSIIMPKPRSWAFQNPPYLGR